jgi:alanine racemase
MEAKHALGEPRLLISRQGLLHNARVIRRFIGPGVKLCAVVKANAYGHGAEIVADTLCNFDGGDTDAFAAPAADQLAVATIEEAVNLPVSAESMIPVLVLRPAENAFLGRQREGIDLAIRRGWTLTLATASAADDVARIAQASGRRAAVHVMVDTGMMRCGTPMDKVDDLIGHIRSREGLRLVSLGTHFACSEVLGEAYNAQQLSRFRGATDEQARRDPRLVRHAANSGAIFFSPESHFDAVRPGIALYGIDPTGKPSVDRPLRPVMRWTAPLLTVRDVPAGQSVGYGQSWRAERDSRVGLVPIGYADGYPRSYSNKAGMLALGQFAPVVGRVSMDLTVIDLTDIPGAVPGDEVVVLDSDPLSPVSVYKLAEWAETIPYEVFCRIGPRVKRVSLEGVESVPAVQAAPSDLIGQGGEEKFE